MDSIKVPSQGQRNRRLSVLSSLFVESGKTRADGADTPSLMGAEEARGKYVPASGAEATATRLTDDMDWPLPREDSPAYLPKTPQSKATEKDKRKSALPTMLKKLQKTPNESKTKTDHQARSRSADRFTRRPRLEAQDRARSSSVHGNRSKGKHVDSARHSRQGSHASASSAGPAQLVKGSRSRTDLVSENTAAWLMLPKGSDTIAYEMVPLLDGDKVSELWNDAGNVCVHLFPKEARKGPSFKVHDAIFASSEFLTRLWLADAMTRDDSEETHLYFPVENTDAESLVAVRNLFALLSGVPLVGTSRYRTYYTALLQVAELLKLCGFTNCDGSSYGPEVEKGLEIFLGVFALADVRDSREKTLEALVLGEHLRCWRLFHEGFCHGVGKYDELMALKSPVHSQMSASTINRLERAHFDLKKRIANTKGRLESFEFPGLFAGIASSTSTEQYRNLRFREWKTHFLRMRGFLLAYYKDLFGSWPPKTRRRKKQLNRQCLLTLYSDLCSLYDLMVDRESWTTRAVNQTKEADEDETVDATTSALRQLLGEFDRSCPPVLPPMPHDVPKMPTMTTIRENYLSLPAKQQAQFDKDLQPHETALMLIKSHNIDIEGLELPFLTAFKEFEHKEASSSLHNMEDQRVGYWVFLYAVLQSLPMLVIDAPELQFTEGVEYFLCEPWRGHPPWMEDAAEVRRMWFQTADDAVVELSADVVMFSVEAVFSRSHCWLAAQAWKEEAAGASAASSVCSSSELSPSRASMRASRAYNRVSIAGLLEPVLPPAGERSRERRTSRLVRSVSPVTGQPKEKSVGSTFDQILKGMEKKEEKGSKTKKRFFSS